MIIKVKILAASMAIASLATVLAPSSFAAAPNNRACLGKDFSGYAHAFQPFGKVITNFEVSGTPIIEGGLGTEIQNHLAGNVPDSVIPNSCNN